MSEEMAVQFVRIAGNRTARKSFAPKGGANPHALYGFDTYFVRCPYEVSYVAILAQALRENEGKSFDDFAVVPRISCLGPQIARDFRFVPHIFTDVRDNARPDCASREAYLWLVRNANVVSKRSKYLVDYFYDEFTLVAESAQPSRYARMSQK